MQRAEASLAVEIEDAAAHDTDGRSRSDSLHLRLESPGQRHIVRVEARDVATGGPFQTPVERRREAQLLPIREHREPRVGERGEQRRRLVGRRVVDDDQLEVAERLPEHALDRGRQIEGVVVDGQEDRDERHGR